MFWKTHHANTWHIWLISVIKKPTFQRKKEKKGGETETVSKDIQFQVHSCYLYLALDLL